MTEKVIAKEWIMEISLVGFEEGEMRVIITMGVRVLSALSSAMATKENSEQIMAM